MCQFTSLLIEHFDNFKIQEIIFRYLRKMLNCGSTRQVND